MGDNYAGGGRISFVPGSIIQSDDGIEFREEEVKRPEAERVHPDVAKLETRSLYEQLKERQDEDKAAEEERRKDLFAPPKGLDEEDLAHFEQLEEQEKVRQDRIREQEEADRKAFTEARARRAEAEAKVTGGGIALPKRTHKAVHKPTLKAVPRARIRSRPAQKKEEEKGEAEPAKRQRSGRAGEADSGAQRKAKGEAGGSVQPKGNSGDKGDHDGDADAAAGGLLGLAAYGDDSD